MIKHKKVTRTLLAVFMALCLFMGPLASKPKAATAGSGTAVSGSTTVCSYSWTFVNNGIYDIGTNLGIIKSSMHVDIELTAYYSGALTITLSGTQSFANIGIFVKGGYLASTSTNQCKIQLIANVSHVEVDFISSIEFQTVPNWSVTVSASGINKIDDLEHTSLDNIDDYTGRISAAVTSTTNGLPAIYNQLDSIDDALTVLQDSITYLSQSVNFERIQTFPVWQQNAIWWANSMGQLQFDRQMPYFYWNAADNTGTFNNANRIKIGRGQTASLIFYCDVNNVVNYINIYGSHSTDITMTGTISPFVPGYPLYLYKIDFQNTYAGSNFITIEFSTNVTFYPLYLGSNLLIPEDVCILMGIEYDNTYTRLLQQINSGISNLGNDQTVIDQSTNTTNNFNTEITKINNIEVNILTGINSKFTDVNTAIDQSGVINGSINNTGIGWANYYSGVVLDNLTIVKYPVYIILIGFVLLCLLG